MQNNVPTPTSPQTFINPPTPAQSRAQSAITMERLECELVLRKAPPAEWHTSVGGKHASFVTTLQVQSNSPGLKLTSVIPVAVTLVYAGTRRQVMDQGHFTLFNTAQIGLDGFCELQTRYNDVSANHQKQNFALLLTPDAGACAANNLVIPAVDGVYQL